MSDRDHRSRDAPGKAETGKHSNHKEDLMKKKETEVLIEGLRKLSKELEDIAGALEGKTEPEPATSKEEKPAKVWTLEEVRGLMADKARSGFRAEVKAVLTAHGAEKLSDVTDPAVLSAIAAEAEVIGNG